MNLNVLWAIFRRNFVSYFSNPTGYVFLCMFVLLTGVAAFWPNEFFNSNLANLDQLNRHLPYILLIFIPAVTMSIWADERRQGTDELLLTIPAGDLEVVLGKYLSATAIYSASLLFSAACTFVVLRSLGDPDIGLFLGMYLGYWVVGLAMLAIGMVASFLTSNLTVAFVLGALFNVPLVFLGDAGAIFSRDLVVGAFGWEAFRIPDFTGKLKAWSIAGQFRDFSRGVVSLSSLAYFFSIAAVMLYLCVVLIGRRHWQGGRDGRSLGPHLGLRAACLTIIAVNLVLLFTWFPLRADVTEERLNSLSPSTKALIKDLDSPNAVLIEAFLSPEAQLPESYMQTRLNLVATLEELAALGERIQVRIYDTELHSDEADRARDRYDIEGRMVSDLDRGAMRTRQIYMGVAVVCGLDKVVIPFFDRGLPVEYELVRSVTTVARRENLARKKLGVLKTDANLMAAGQKRQVIQELEKQYDVIEVDAAAPIEGGFDVLLAVQPSSLPPEEMTNFIQAVRRGVPTAIFEDPMPAFTPSVAGTGQPKQPPGGMFGFGGPPAPKGDISPLWQALGVTFRTDDIVWQDFNPHAKWEIPYTELVIVSANWEEESFNQDSKITSKLQEMLFPFPGYITRSSESKTGLNYTPLVFTRKDNAGTIAVSDSMTALRSRSDTARGKKYKLNENKYGYTLAAHIQGKLPADKSMHDGEHPHSHDDAGGHDTDGQVNVVLVSDMDCLSDAFFTLRQMGDDPLEMLSLHFDNVTFVLTVLDVLAGDERYVDIRKRRPRHRTLTLLEDQSGDFTKQARVKKENIRTRLQNKVDELHADARKQIEAVRRQLSDQQIGEEERLRREQLIRSRTDQRTKAVVEAAERDAEVEIAREERALQRSIENLQNRYKWMAVALPPVLPLLIGIAVFFNRRAREREGVSRRRLLQT